MAKYRMVKWFEDDFSGLLGKTVNDDSTDKLFEVIEKYETEHNVEFVQYGREGLVFRKCTKND